MNTLQRAPPQIRPIVHSAVRLAEGPLEIRYSDIQQFLRLLAGQLLEYGVSSNDTLWVDLRHDLAHGLLLIFLLENEFSFVAAGPDTGGKEVLSIHCAWEISVESFFPSGPSIELDIRRNPLFSEKQAQRDEQNVYFFTSGSTGQPKLAAHEKSRLLGNALNCVERFDLDCDCRMALPVPFWHMFGFGAGFLPGVMAGAAIDIQGASNVIRFFEREQSFRPDVAYLTPSQVTGISRVRRRPHAYKLTVVAGDTLNRETITRFESMAGNIVQLYGSTEMGAIAASSPHDDPLNRANTVGQPMRGVECRLMPDTHILLCRHPFGFAGYLDHTGDLNTRLRDEWFNTHDIADITPSGRLKIFGRSDHRVNRDGTLVDLDTIEESIEKIDCIDSCVCAADGDGPRGKEIIAFCTLSGEYRAGADEIRKRCFDMLNRREVPDFIVILQELPLLANGKIDLHNLLSGWRTRGQG